MRFLPHDPWDDVAAARRERLELARRRWQGANAVRARARPGAVAAMAALGAGYILSYMLRNVNAVAGPDITRELGLGPAALGQATAAYFLLFAAVQLPVGVLLDRVGPRRVQAALMLCTAAGAAIAAADLGFAGLVAGRALIGVGTAAALTAGLKAAASWFRREQLPTIGGTLVLCGGLGALAATWPAEAMLQLTGWHGLYLALAAVAVLLAAAVWLLVPELRPAQAGAAEQVRLKSVLRDPLFIAFAPVFATSTGAVMAVHGLWTGPFLTAVEGLDRSQVATMLAAMAVALMAAAPLWGALARAVRLRMDLSVAASLASVALLLVELLIVVRPGVPAAVPWCLFGLFGSMTVLHFSVIAEHFPAAALGRANGLINVAQIGCAFGVQVGIGQALAWSAGPGEVPGPAAYRCVMMLPIGLQVAALGWFAWRTCRGGAMPLVGGRTT